jgi:recombination protein RecT
MVGGICKKVRNSGELATLDSQVVHEKDEYDSWTDEKGPHFKHKKARGERGKPIITYAYATTKDGSFFFEELTEEDIQAIRSASKAKDSGPWAGPFADEMRRKSAVRRLAKYRLPSSTDLDTVIRRDDELFDFSKPSEDDILPLQKPTTITPQLEEGPSIEDVDGEFNQLIVNMTVDNFAEMKVEAFKLFKHVKGDEKKLIDMTKTLNARQKDLGL